MKTKVGKRIRSTVLALLLMVGMAAAIPMRAGAVAVDIGNPQGLLAGANLTGTEVYFGSDGGDPIKWHVVATDTGNVTLWTTTSMGNRAYDGSNNHNNWSGSEICEYLNTAFLNTFSKAEQAAIPLYGDHERANTYAAWGDYDIDIGQKIVLPSYQEVIDSGIWGMSQSDRVHSDLWWLRSPGSNPGSAALVNVNGNVVPDSNGVGDLVDNTFAIRPAFKLNLSSVLFTSAAAGGKGACGTPSLSAATTPTGAVKLTVISDYNSSTNPGGLSLNTAVTQVSAASGGTVEIPYTDAQIGAGRSVSVAICDKDTGAVLFYGRPVDCDSDNASGTATFDLPDVADLPDGDYTLRIFNEEVNDANETDYASTPKDIALTVDNTPPSPSTSQVYYGGQLYRLVAGDATTMTLFMDDDLGSMAYDSRDDHNDWSGSEICGWLNSTFLSTFSTAEQAAIPVYGGQERANTYAAWGDYDIDIGQKIVLPSYQEVIDSGTWGMSQSDRAHSGHWWLRSPGMDTNGAALATTDGGVVPDSGSVGYRVLRTFAIRPAFKLNLSSVLFTSAASGESGKSSVTVGGGFVGASSPTSAQKFTVTDVDGITLAVESVSLPAGADALTVHYNADTATTGQGHYIACVLVDENDEVAYYAKLEDINSDASGSAEVDFTGVSNGSYTLRIFNEQANDDYETDYASQPWDIAIEVADEKPVLSIPAVYAVTPANGPDNVPVDGEITITFSEEMNTTVNGSVTLRPSAGTSVTLGTGTWNNTKTEYTLSYTGLAYGTGYTIEVSGFQSAKGAQMNTDTNAASFTTEPLVHAETPDITQHPANGVVQVNGTMALTTAAQVADGGILSYQWYSNTSGNTTTGTAISGATGESYSVPTSQTGTTYYYVVVTNTNNTVNGTKTATATSNAVSVRVADQVFTLPGVVRVGDTFTVTPSEYDTTGGTGWSYSTEYLQGDFSGNTGAEFTALRDGNATITYTSTEGLTASANINIQKGQLDAQYIQATGYSGSFDGNSHGITVNVGSEIGAHRIVYSEDGQTWRSEPYTYSAEGNYPVHYRVSKDYYESHEGVAYVYIGSCTHTNWGGWTETSPATCTEQGQEQRVCGTCGYTETRPIAALGHAWGAEQTQAPTCTESGYTYRECGNCGEVETLEILMPTGHAWGEWKTTTPATDTKEGEEQRECAKCNETQRRAIPPTATEKPALTFGGLPANNTVQVGEKFTLTPSEDGQTGSTGWKWDSEYFSATFNSPATFTALKAGASTITYTAADGRSASVTITVQAASDSSTGGNGAIAATGDQARTGLYRILATFAAAGLCGGGLFWRKRRRAQR